MTTVPAPTILIVDDELAIRDLLQATLESAGYHVYVATDGETALAVMQQNPPDLVLTDLMMPGIDGRALAGHLQAAAGTARIPIVLVSVASLPDPGDPFVAVLHKPFDLDHLLELIQCCLAS